MTHKELIAQVEKLEQRANSLESQLKELKRLIFGKKSERFVPLAHGEGQMELPFDVEEKPAEKAVQTEEITYKRKKKIVIIILAGFLYQIISRLKKSLLSQTKILQT